MKWSEATLPDLFDGSTTPQIKNHSVTYHGGYLYCFGGYDGRRNHLTLLIYSIREGRWITANNVLNAPPPGRNGHTATLATCFSSSRSLRRRRRRRSHLIAGINDATDAGDGAESVASPYLVAEQEVPGKSMDAELDTTTSAHDCEHNNISAVSNENAQGGENDAINHHSNPHEEEVDDSDNGNNNVQLGEDGDIDDEDAQIIIIGGWLGSGPLAASDTWVLDISGGLEQLCWFQPPVLGIPPGPCNMHSADFIPSRGEVYVFRGGNGREYLNDLHALDGESYIWRAVQTHGTAPQQRANHSSALLEDVSNGTTTSQLFIFGGWNGSERLNDIHVLDTTSSTWSTPRVTGVKPHPRAGMTLTALRGRLYLFGGSGTSSKCFDDLQVLDRQEMAWLDVNEVQDPSNRQHLPSYGAPSYHDNSRENNRGELYFSSWDMLGGQDGMVMGGGRGGGNNNNQDDTGMKFRDWRSYAESSGGVCSRGETIRSVANPNDEEDIESVYVNGKPPGKRAGHTATAVGRHIYVFGGSCGTDYLNDFFVLDTDPAPAMKITEPPSPQLYAHRLQHFYNDEEFSDVTFLVEGRKVFGHKLVLSSVSDCFRAMFMTGFREGGSEKTNIEIPNCSHSSFCTMMEYIYTGRGLHNINVIDGGIDRAISLLELADQFLLYNLKQIVEGILQPAVNSETYMFLRQVAEKTNANQLDSYCQYFERNMYELRE